MPPGLPPPLPPEVWVPSIGIIAVAAALIFVLAMLLLAMLSERMGYNVLQQCPCLATTMRPLYDGDESKRTAASAAAQDAELKIAIEDPPSSSAKAAPPSHSDDDDRRRLRERIVGLTAEDRTLQAQRAALEGGIESTEMAEAAEAAVSAAGSPEAALLAAVSRGASPVEVRALLRRGANPDAAFLDRGALAVAARSCTLGVVKVLVDAGATLDMKDGRGWTPLMHAIDAHNTGHTREGVLTLLLDAGAAVDVWGNDLTRPLDLLERREHQQAQQQSELRLTNERSARQMRPRLTDAYRSFPTGERTSN